MGELICPHCRGDAEIHVIEEALGRYGNARVRITGLPVLRCTYCQKLAPRSAEFIGDMTRVLAASNELPMARLIGLFRKQPGCCDCKAPLQGGESGPVNYEAELEITEPAFRVALSVLATSCPQCDARQIVLHGTPLEQDIHSAILRALESVAVTSPTGSPAYSG